VAPGYRCVLCGESNHRLVRGDKDVGEKLGRNDLCPCESGRRFQEVLLAQWSLRGCRSQSLLLDAVRS
jgi:hypothetical protein